MWKVTSCPDEHFLSLSILLFIFSRRHFDDDDLGFWVSTNLISRLDSEDTEFMLINRAKFDASTDHVAFITACLSRF